MKIYDIYNEVKCFFVGCPHCRKHVGKHKAKFNPFLVAGDGIHDDSIWMESEINSGYCYLEQGVYLIECTMNVHGYIKGQGKDKTIIKFKG